MNPPRVSVVLPTHNRAAMLPLAIGSVLGQTFSDLELIVVDDASTDDTPEVVGAVEDPRLVYVRLERQRGAAVARNTGIRRARGELVAFQDSDDEWLPSKLADQIQVLEGSHGSVRAVGGRYSIDAGASSAHVTAPNLEAGGSYEAELLEGPCCITPLWLIERSLLDELELFDERMPCLEDWDLMLRLSERTPMRALSHDVLIKRGAPDSLGADVDRRAPAMKELLRRHGKRFAAQPRRHASFCLELSYLCLLRGESADSARYALRALHRRGATLAMLRAFGRACLLWLRHRQRIWPIPGLEPT